MENLNDEVAEANSCLFVSLGLQQMLRHCYYLFSFNHLFDLFMANEYEVLKGRGTVKEKEHVFGLLDEVQDLWESRNDFLEVFSMLFSISFP